MQTLSQVVLVRNRCREEEPLLLKAEKDLTDGFDAYKNMGKAGGVV